jgi:predicted dehydrogenase
MNIPEIKINLPKLTATRKKLKWGVAGLGKYSEQTFIPALLLCRKSKLNSVFSNTPERAKAIAEKYAVPGYCSDYDEFLKSDIQAVYVGSANDAHKEYVIKAAKAGKHILCDKPLALSSAEAKEMIRVCEENKVQLAVNYTQRFHPVTIKAKELIDAGFIGKIVTINANFNAYFPPDNNFRFTKEKSGGGALRDIGTHLIDIMRYFGGEISGIQGVCDNVIYNSEVDDYSAGIVNFKNGGHGVFTVSFNTRKSFNRLEILGHTGAICIENLVAGKNQPARIILLHEHEGKKVFKKRGNKLVHLIKAVQNSFLTNTVPPVTGYDGLVNLELMEELENRWKNLK